MSTTYHLECETCRESIWIGQRNFIYTAEKDTMENLGRFLYRHAAGLHDEHALFFRADTYSGYMDGQDEWVRWPKEA